MHNPTHHHTRKLLVASTVITVTLTFIALWFYFNHRITPKPLHTNQQTQWVTGYLPAYRHNGREIPFLGAEDYAMLTHIAHASAIPRPDGTLDTTTNNYLPESRHQAVQTAHTNQRPILLVIAAHHDLFSPAIQAGTRQALIRNILQMLDEDGYDGVDIDMEPVTLDENRDNPDFRAFIHELHTALQTRISPLLGRPPLLTAATTLRDRHIIAQLANKFDQINLMAYDMAQPHEGWIPWFDSPLQNGGLVFPGFSHQVPSIENWVNAFVETGVPRHKLGLGISFDVACWQGGETTPGEGVTQPRTPWRVAPTYFKRSYAEMHMQNRIPAHYQWDETAQMAWFGVDAANSADDMFCNFNDARAIKAKISFARQQGLGGIMIWELALDAALQPDASVGSRPLRQVIGDMLQK